MMKPGIRYISLGIIAAWIAYFLAGCSSSRVSPGATQAAGEAAPLTSATSQVGPTQAPAVIDTPLPASNPLPAATLEATAASPTVFPAASETPAGVFTKTPASNPASNPATPTADITKSPEDFDSAIRILSPGPASKVTSPILFRALIKPGPTGLVEVALLGEDGRLLMRDVRYYDVSPGQALNVGMKIQYEITAVAEAGRIQISTVDKQDRLLALDSVNVLLLSIGDSDINPPEDGSPSILIQEPDPGAFIQGGVVHVAGLARLGIIRPLMVDFKTADGRIIATRQVNVTHAAGGYGSFSIDVPYTVIDSTSTRLSVWAPGDRIPGTVYLYSLEVMLSP